MGSKKDTIKHIRDIFYKMGFKDREIVALSVRCVPHTASALLCPSTADGIAALSPPPRTLGDREGSTRPRPLSHRLQRLLWALDPRPDDLFQRVLPPVALRKLDEEGVCDLQTRAPRKPRPLSSWPAILTQRASPPAPPHPSPLSQKWDGPEQYEDSTGELMMLPSDMALVWDPVFRKFVQAYADDYDLFAADFAKAFNKLEELGVDAFHKQSWSEKFFRKSLLW